MSNNLIESFLKYEEQRKAQKNPNEFQSAKNLHEFFGLFNRKKEENAGMTQLPSTGAEGREALNLRNRPGAGSGMLPPPAGAGEALRPEIARNAYDVNRAAPEQGPSISAMAKPGDTRFGKFNSDGTVSGNTSVTAARAGVRTEPRATTPSTGDPVRDKVNAGAAMSTPGAEMAVTNSGGDQVSIVTGRNPDGTPLTQGQGEDGQPMMGPEPEVKSSTGGSRSITGSPERNVPRESSVARAEREAGEPPRPELASVGTRTTNLRVGSRGDDVRTAQQALGISDDGVYGNQTRQAVMDFQRKHGLQVDGIIGDQTMSALRRARVGLSVRGSGAATNESVEFSEAELAHFKSILEAMPVAPTAEGHGPNPTPKNKAEGGKGRGSLSEKMDPVGEEDDDVNNDGEVKPDDEYLRRRRNAIADNMKKKK